MAVVTCTLVTDGTSDRVLIPILQWLLDTHCPSPTRLNFAQAMPTGTRTLSDRIASALDLFPCDLLFVHRDAERDSLDARQLEIETAWATQTRSGVLITVIPVRMTEAWLLLDEVAIRAAAGNPNGQGLAGLPAASRIEQIPDPKEVLFDLLRRLSGLPTGRLRKFDPGARRHRIADLMQSFALLRELPSFARLETQVQKFFQL